MVKQCPTCLRVQNDAKQWTDMDLPLQKYTEHVLCKKCEKVVMFPLRHGSPDPLFGLGKTVRARKSFRQPLILRKVKVTK